MQLKSFKQVNTALAAASCALLGQVVNVQTAQAESRLDGWQIDTAVMYYGETDRVTALEGVVNAQKDFGESHIFNGKLVLDTLTGASANGAVAQPQAQTFTRPSGKGEYTTQANGTPLDDTFRDTRVQLNAQWSQPLQQNNTISGGIHFSNEYDYTSIALNSSFARDFNKKNTTMSVGLSYAFDSISPEGGLPVAGSRMALRSQYSSESEFLTGFDATRQAKSDESKDTLDLIFGLTQIINRRWIVQLNYGISQVDGYLTDPFKVVSLVDEQGYTQDNIYESRPGSRTKQNIFTLSKYHFNQSILDLSYRFTTDDWGINSHTIDSKLRFNLSETSYITPHIRYYQQSAADFYKPFITESVANEFMSADYRIGQMTATTLGLKYGHKLDNGHEWGVRVEYYMQTPENADTSEFGVLSQVDLYPSIKALIVQFNYSF